MTTTIAAQAYGSAYGGSGPENYERYFVPAIGGPLAHDLIARADLRAGDRVLDVACGTGIVTRLAAERVGSSGTVAGVDVNAGMLGVARSIARTQGIRWYETSAETMPLPDESFDVVLCQLGLQFFQDKSAALRQVYRVLAPGGRVIITVPGPNPFFSVLHDAIERHLSAEDAAFVSLVFSAHEVNLLRQLLADAGFRDVDVRSEEKVLQLPGPEDFLWQYVYSTPMMLTVGQLSDERKATLQREVAAAWQPWLRDEKLSYRQPIAWAAGKK